MIVRWPENARLLGWLFLFCFVLLVGFLGGFFESPIAAVNV